MEALYSVEARIPQELLASFSEEKMKDLATRLHLSSGDTEAPLWELVLEAVEYPGFFGLEREVQERMLRESKLAEHQV